MKKTRRALISSVISLLLCFTMLVGTTFAWFTDAVTSSGNIIKSGTLDVKMLWSKDLATWNDVDLTTEKIFDYDNWEPGHTEIRYVQIQNAGSLALKYLLSISAVGEVGILADVIDVYYAENPTSPIADRALSGMTKVNGTLSSLAASGGKIKEDVLLPASETSGEYDVGTVTVAIAFKMQESAGNEYQGKSFGDSFDIKLVATQYGYEGDSFGKDYDEGLTLPDSVGSSISATVETDAENRTLFKVTKASKDGNTVLTIPANVKMADGSTAASLNIDEISAESSKANIVLDENEEAFSLDVHVDGIASDNTTPVGVYMAKALPVGLNIGNYKLYHVENGATVIMTSISESDTPVHNSFVYDELTGDVTVHMATFSEVAVVADTENAWEGEFDYSWYDASKTDFTIANADQLAAFGAIVGGMDGQTQDSFNGKTVKLIADVNLGDKEGENNPDIIFYPIGYYNSEGTYERTNTAITSGLRNFEGTFDGNGNTISNFYQNTWEMKGDHDWYSPEEQYYRDGMGLFGRVYGGTVKNLTVSNFSSDGEIATTGVIAAYAEGATFENIAIVDCNPRVYNIGNGGIVGCVGWYAKEAGLKTTFKNITVDNSNKISALWGSYDVACGGIVGQYYPTSGQTSAGTPKNGGIHFENCHISAQMDVYNDVCANYQYYAYRYTGMLIGSVRENETIDGHSYPKMDGITAEGCTVHFGDWNDYYYCELVANSLASYTHDHQFSRLEQVASVDVENKTVTDLKGNTTPIPESGRANYVVVNGEHATENATCYHFVDGKVHDHDDYNGDGVDDYETVNGESILVENNRHIYLEFNNLVTGYGWGVTSRGFDNLDGVTNLDIAQGDQEASVEKFDAIINGDSFETETTLTLGEIFAIKDNVNLNLDTLNVFVSPVGDDSTVSAVYVAHETDWALGTVTFSGIGAAKITISDYTFCKETTTSITIRDFDAIDKFVANGNLTFEHVLAGDTISKTLGDIFSAKDGVTINSANVVVTVDNNDATCVYNKNTNDWTESKLEFTGNGSVTITITDEDYCNTATATVNIKNPEKKDLFTIKFPNVKSYLYRVGNANEVKLSSLFGGTLPTGAEVYVTVDNVGGDTSGTYTSNATWTNGTVRFSGTGVVEVTIDSNAFTVAKTLIVEVIDAVNATSATSATSNNVVLLNDIGSGFTVSGRYAVYGNGFTLNYTGNGQYLNNGLKQGLVTVSENGTLDNLNIKCSIYPIAALYREQVEKYYEYEESSGKTRYFYQLSAVAASDNATISNCYIYGARTNIFVNTGNVTIKDSVLECGVVSNIQIVSNNTHTVTLENVTTIQHKVTPTTYADDSLKNNVLLGFGVLVGDGESASNPKIIINGAFKQYNWVNSDDANDVSDTYVKQAIRGALEVEKYIHTLNGKDSANMGIVYLNTSTHDFENNTGLPYEYGTVSISGVTGQVYSLVNATEQQIYNDYENANKSTVNGLYTPQFKFDSSTLGDQYIENTTGCDEFCYVEDGILKVMFISGEEKTINLLDLVNVTKYGNQDLALTVSVKDANGNAVDISDGKITLNKIMAYTATYSVTDSLFYDKDGTQIADTKNYSWNVKISVALKDKSTPNAYFDYDTNKQTMGYGKKSAFAGGQTQYLPFLAGLKIYDYNGQNSYLRFDGDSDFNKIAAAEITGYTSANHVLIKVTLTDGGVINIDTTARAASGGSTYTGKLQTNNNTLYYVNDGTTSATTTTWVISNYSFIGNNGVTINSGAVTFSNCANGNVPTGSFGTTINYTVTYDANEGICGQAYGYATSASGTVTLPTPTRPGYVCKGWYTAASGGEFIGATGESYTPSANTTLYAQWRCAGTVLFDGNGGTSSEESAYYDLTAPITLPSAERDGGYVFVGWFTEKVGGTKIGVAGDEFTPDGDVTIYAQWTKACTVTYDHYYGQGDITTATYDGVNALTLPSLRNDNGFWFEGWYDSQLGGNYIGAGGDSYIPAGNDITLYAHWKNDVTVEFNANGGTCGTTNETYQGTALTLPTPTRTGYNFLGWYPATTGGDKIGDAGSSYSPNYELQGGPISETLYAQWEQISYTITINKQENATVTVDKTTAHYGDTISVTVKFSQNNNKTLTVKDESGNSVLSKDADGTYTFTMPDSNVTIEASSERACVTSDTLVMLADGTEKRIDEVTTDDMLLVWNFYTGDYDIVPAAIIFDHGYGDNTVIKLDFSNGASVKVVNMHQFFDATLNKMVTINADSVQQYIGHEFICQDGDGYSTVTLDAYTITNEYVEAWGIMSALHYNIIVEGIFSADFDPADLGLFNYFEIGDDMKYDEDKMNEDIEKYGLYTYEDFADYLTYEQFVAFNVQYFKIAVERGDYTFEGILNLIEEYLK